MVTSRLGTAQMFSLIFFLWFRYLKCKCELLFIANWVFSSAMAKQPKTKMYFVVLTFVILLLCTVEVMVKIFAHVKTKPLNIRYSPSNFMTTERLTSISRKVKDSLSSHGRKEKRNCTKKMSLSTLILLVQWFPISDTLRQNTGKAVLLTSSAFFSLQEPNDSPLRRQVGESHVPALWIAHTGQETWG